MGRRTYVYNHMLFCRYPSDMTKADLKTFEVSRHYTMTEPKRIFALIRAVKYLICNKIAGAIVECGVGAGGSIVAIARTLRTLGDTERDIYLYDTYAGMPKPGPEDVRCDGIPAMKQFKRAKLSDTASRWCRSPRTKVKSIVKRKSGRYPSSRFKFIKGMIEDTIPEEAPDNIALLLLDTDFYRSTLHGLNHLYPRLQGGGVLMVDDYGYWKGARQAVDEYFTEHGNWPLLNATDYSGRIGVKPWQ